MSKKYSLGRSFYFAAEGIKTAFKKEPNFRLHLIIAAAVLVTAAFLRFTGLEWLILAFTIFFVLILELINTALEAIVDLISPEIKPTAKLAKDVSAAAVFLAALAAFIVGLILFLPKILLKG